MKIFVAFGGHRLSVRIKPGLTKAKAIKDMIRYKFDVSPTEQVVILSFAGSSLQDEWVLTDIGVSQASTLKCTVKDVDRPILFIHSVYNGQTIVILDDENVKLYGTTVGELRGLVSKKCGLPITTFRLTKDGVGMYDCNTLDQYNVEIGTTLRLETWNGWNDFLKAAADGNQSLVSLYTSSRPTVARFQNRVAMFIAAHFGHSSLAKQLIRTGTRPDDPVGEHPARQWCHTLSHIERLKTPVHEAAEFGQLTVLRVFLFYDFSCVTQPDGHGLLPLSYSLRNKHKECALFLLNKISVILNCHGSGMVCSMNIYRKMRRWANRARTRVCLLNGVGGALYQRNQDVFKERGLVGQGVIVDGFGRSERSAVPRSKMPRTPADTLRIGMNNVKNVLVITPTNGKRPRQEGGRWKKTGASRLGAGACKDFGPHKEKSSLHLSLPGIKSRKWSSSVRGSFSSQKSVDCTEVAGESKTFNGNSPTRLALPSLGLDVTRTNSRLSGQSTGLRTPRSEALQGRDAPNVGDLVFGKPEGSHPVVRSRASRQPPEDSPRRKTKQPSVIHQLPPIACHTNTELSKAFRNAFRTIDSHEDAKGCFQVAASFKEMPFLKQMKLAARLTKQSVKNQNSILQKGEVR
ncbi:protein ANKUB1-like [Branchiostoma floridae]|uniref:Protein ANKUB1-like n=1 Tax=Branchiostoma floridae TaxID=7739 RepID=A0A9J7N6E0_BRAFL|nr:protein ANKUB1-like [Branchiostoma floridae]